ncbi:MAG: C4-dicarboxylate ABC transporter permease, partial [Pseudomonadota bacterium]
AKMSVAQVVMAALPWVAIMFVFLLIVTYVPAVSTWLPTTLMGPEIITK